MDSWYIKLNINVFVCICVYIKEKQIPTCDHVSDTEMMCACGLWPVLPLLQVVCEI